MLKKLFDHQIIFALLIIVAAWFLFEIKSILISLFIALIISSTISPIAEKLESRGVPRTLSIICIFLTGLIAITVLIIPLVPFVTSQGQSLVANFPLYVSQMNSLLGSPFSESDINALITTEFNHIGRSLLQTSSKILGGLLTLISTVVISFYLSLEHTKLKKGFISLFSAKNQVVVGRIVNQAEAKLGAWVRGQIILCVFIGALTYIALRLLGVEYALVLAILAGILEIIPTVGPIISAIPALVVAFSVSPVSAIGVISAYLLIQQAENNLLVPKIMNAAIGLSPILIILGVITGSQLLGIPGALLAIPFITVLSVIIANLRSSKV